MQCRPEMIDNGIRIKMYEEYPYLYMQTNKTPEFVHIPDWFTTLISRRTRRGYPYKEDLLLGYFELPMRKEKPLY